jgi:hypothetical protein
LCPTFIFVQKTITAKMDNVPAPHYQKVWSNLIQNLRREYKNATVQYPDASGVIDPVHVVPVDIARLAGSTPSSVGDSHPWSEVVLNAAETSRNLHGFLKGKPLYSALYGVYAKVLQDLKTVPRLATAAGCASPTFLSRALLIDGTCFTRNGIF